MESLNAHHTVVFPSVPSDGLVPTKNAQEANPMRISGTFLKLNWLVGGQMFLNN